MRHLGEYLIPDAKEYLDVGNILKFLSTIDFSDKVYYSHFHFPYQNNYVYIHAQITELQDGEKNRQLSGTNPLFDDFSHPLNRSSIFHDVEHFPVIKI